MGRPYYQLHLYIQDFDTEERCWMIQDRFKCRAPNPTLPPGICCMTRDSISGQTGRLLVNEGSSRADFYDPVADMEGTSFGAGFDPESEEPYITSTRRRILSVVTGTTGNLAECSIMEGENLLVRFPLNIFNVGMIPIAVYDDTEGKMATFYVTAAIAIGTMLDLWKPEHLSSKGEEIHEECHPLHIQAEFSDTRVKMSYRDAKLYCHVHSIEKAPSGGDSALILRIYVEQPHSPHPESGLDFLSGADIPRRVICLDDGVIRVVAIFDGLYSKGTLWKLRNNFFTLTSANITAVLD
ncbi:hypothetical protein C8R43DRAFT_942488 [Mycena crocata]|nr:hypothetical protein C8R43DRAFT_942488 [Mycena crocata]